MPARTKRIPAPARYQSADAGHDAMSPKSTGSDSAVPEPVRQLLVEHLSSLEELIILLLLHRDPRQLWSVVALADELEFPQSLVTEALRALRGRQLIELRSVQPERYGYRSSGAQARAVDALASAYAADPLQPLKILTDESFARVRGSAARFVDTFSPHDARARRDVDGPAPKKPRR